MLADLAEAAGCGGMVGGQVADLESEGVQVTADTVDYIHAHKTGALIRTSLRVGAVLCGATAAQTRVLSIAGESLGEDDAPSDHQSVVLAGAHQHASIHRHDLRHARRRRGQRAEEFALVTRFPWCRHADILAAGAKKRTGLGPHPA